MMHVCDNISDALRHSSMTGFPLMIMVHSASISVPSTTESSTANLKGLYNETNGQLASNYSLDHFHSGAEQRQAMEAILQSTQLGSAVIVHFIEHATTDYNNFAQVIPPAPSLAAPGSGVAAFPQVFVFPSSRIVLSMAKLSGEQVTAARLYSAIKAAQQLPLGGARTDTMLPNGEFMMLGAGATQHARADALTTFQTQLREEVEHIHTMKRSTGASAGSNESKRTSATAQSAPNAASDTASSIAAESSAPSLSSIPFMHIIRILQLPGGRKKTIVTNATMRLSTVWHDVAHQLKRAEQEARAAGEFWDSPRAHEHFTLRLVHCSKDSSADAHVPNTAIDSKSESETTTTSASEKEESRQCTVQYVQSVSEAEQVVLSSLPSGTCVYVQLPDKIVHHTRGPVTHAAEETRSGQSGRTEQAKASWSDISTATARPTAAARATTEAVVNACVETASPTMSPTSSSSSHAHPSTQADAAATTVSGTKKVEESALILIRCTLPDGRAENFDSLSPTRATIQHDIRPRIAELLQHNRFVFVRSYPQQRYRPESDEMQTLQSLGLTTRSTLRVVEISADQSKDAKHGVSDSAHADPNKLWSAAAAAPSALAHAGATSVNMLGSMLQRLLTAGGSDSNNTAANPARSNRVLESNRQQEPPRHTRATGVHRMTDLLAVQEAEVNEETQNQAQQQRIQQMLQQFRANHEAGEQQQRQSSPVARKVTLSGAGSSSKSNLAHEGDAHGDQSSASVTKKSNRYFGGDSTEFIARDVGEEEEQHSDETRSIRAAESARRNERSAESATHSTQAFSGTGHRLSGRNVEQRQQQQQQQQAAHTTPRHEQDGTHDCIQDESV